MTMSVARGYIVETIELAPLDSEFRNTSYKYSRLRQK